VNKNLAYYRSLPYEREWLPRDDESGRYFVVRLKHIPEIYGTGFTKQAALTVLNSAFDDQIAWALKEGLAIPEPSVGPVQSTQTHEITLEQIPPSVLTPIVRWSQGEQASTRTAEVVESCRGSQPIDVGELQRVA
jgi:hypothetical protein